MVYFLLSISVVLNICFLLYLRVLLRKLYFVSENILGLLSLVEQYSSHLNVIYESEMYYGDESLQSLQEHTKMVLDEIVEYKDIYSIYSDPDLDDAETPEDEEQEVVQDA